MGVSKLTMHDNLPKLHPRSVQAVNCVAVLAEELAVRRARVFAVSQFATAHCQMQHRQASLLHLELP